MFQNSLLAVKKKKGYYFSMEKIGFIGGGNMAFALASSFYQKDNNLKFFLYDPDRVRCDLFKSTFNDGVEICSDPNLVVKSSKLLILAVKPQMLSSVASALGSGIEALRAQGGVVLSILAGISISRLSEIFSGVAIARLMPNTPCLIGEMAGGLVFNQLTTSEDKDKICKLLSYAGDVVVVEEALMDGVTALSGSGPAFVAAFIEAFIKAGVDVGLSYEDASFLTLATFSGTANLLKAKGLSPSELIKMVSSPQGTTVAGLEKLNGSNYNQIVSDTILAAAKRSKELGASN